MQGTVILRAGTPNDENRDYLPEAIKGSDMVVNENGNNSQPYPERLVECTGTLTEDGLSDRWYEYVPESYDGSEPVPLVVGNHGGLMTGWGHAIYTSWTMVADREGFICVFPDAHQARIWQVEGMFNDHTPTFLGDRQLAKVPADYRENQCCSVCPTRLSAIRCLVLNIKSGLPDSLPVSCNVLLKWKRKRGILPFISTTIR